MRPDVVTLLGPGSRSNDGIMVLVRVVMCYKCEPIYLIPGKGCYK